jgi:hypothetical protein
MQELFYISNTGRSVVNTQTVYVSFFCEDFAINASLYESGYSMSANMESVAQRFVRNTVVLESLGIKTQST